MKKKRFAFVSSDISKASINTKDPGKIIENFKYFLFDEVLCEQPPPYSQLTVSIWPIAEYYEKNSMNLPAIVKLRFFFLLSTIIYTLWGLSAFVVTIILGLISSCIPYFILWSVFLLFDGLINTFTVVMFKSVNECNRLKHMVHFTFFVNTIGFLLTAVGSNSKLAMMHPDWLHSPLNTVLTSYLQWLLVFIFIMTTLQNMWTIAMVYKLEKIIKQIQIQTVVRS